MIKEEIKQLQTGERDLRKFGLLVGGVLAALGILLWARGKGHFPYFLAPGVVLLALGLAWPKALRLVYLGWMTIAILLGFVVSHVLLTLFFFLVIAPVGLVARGVGKDFLRLRLDRKATTYWQGREDRGERPCAEYERQF